MATIDVPHLCEYSRAIEDENGLRFIEGYKVDNLSGRFALLDALTSGVLPPYGDPLPGYSNMFVIQRLPKPFASNSKTSSIIEVVYGPPNFDNIVEPVVEYHGTTVEVETSVDRFRKPIVVSYGSPVLNPFTGAGSFVEAFPDQIGRVRARKAIGVLTYDFPFYTDPSVFVDIQNTINNATWRGKPVTTWYCTETAIRKDFYRSGWKIHLEFLYDSESHIPTSFYRLDPGSTIPKDIDTPVDVTKQFGNGWTNADLYPLYNFNTLPLPLPQGF